MRGCNDIVASTPGVALAGRLGPLPREGNARFPGTADFGGSVENLWFAARPFRWLKAQARGSLAKRRVRE